MIKFIEKNESVEASQIEKLKNEHGIDFPEEFVAIYKRSNGGLLDRGYHFGVPFEGGNKIPINQFLPIEIQNSSESIRETNGFYKNEDQNNRWQNDLMIFGEAGDIFWAIGWTGARKGQVFIVNCWDLTKIEYYLIRPNFEDFILNIKDVHSRLERPRL